MFNSETLRSATVAFLDLGANKQHSQEALRTAKCLKMPETHFSLENPLVTSYTRV